MEVPWAKPTPITEPTRVWVGEIGIPYDMKMKKTREAAIWAEKPLVGTSSVMRLPIVSVTRSPRKSIPITSPRAPTILRKLGFPPDRLNSTPIATPRSKAPTLNAEKDELNN